MFKAGLAAAVSATITGCITVSDSQPRREVVDLVSPTPGTAPLPTTPAELDGELVALQARLAAVPEGAPADQGPVKDACLRLAALGRDGISTAARESVGLSNLDYLLLLEASRECPESPRKSSESLTRILKGLPSAPTAPAAE